MPLLPQKRKSYLERISVRSRRTARGRILEPRLAESAAVDRLLRQRGKQILGLLGMGLTNEEVGAILGLSEKTAQILRHRLLAQLGNAGSAKSTCVAADQDLARVYLETYYGPAVPYSTPETTASEGLSDQWSAVLSRPSIGTDFNR